MLVNNMALLNSITCGDFSVIQDSIPDESIDLVLTDPPYAKKYFHTYEYLAEYCPRIMKRGASLLTIVPHYSLPSVINTFEGKLKYRWIMCMNQFDGRHARMAMGIEILWKPTLWYVKGSYPQGRGFIKDGVVVSESKDNHQWQQDSAWAEFFISKLTNDGDTVLDPYVGKAATVALVAKRLNRNFIGIEINDEYALFAQDQISNST